MTEDENSLLLRLNESLQRVDRWLELVGQNSGAWSTREGSELYGDDRLAHPYSISSAAWHAITAAISHSDCLKVSLFQHEAPEHLEARIGTHGQYSLIRGMLENASRGIWLLAPDNQQQRILRRLQQDWDEQTQLEQVSTKIFKKQPDKTRAERRDALKKVAREAGINDASTKVLESCPGYEKIVKIAAEFVSDDPTFPHFVWKACSALAHGDLRGSLMYSTFVKVEEASPGMALGKISGSIKLLSMGGEIAVRTVDCALNLYGKRAGQREN